MPTTTPRSHGPHMSAWPSWMARAGALLAAALVAATAGCNGAPPPEAPPEPGPPPIETPEAPDDAAPFGVPEETGEPLGGPFEQHQETADPLQGEPAPGDAPDWLSGPVAGEDAPGAEAPEPLPEVDDPVGEFDFGDPPAPPDAGAAEPLPEGGLQADQFEWPPLDDEAIGDPETDAIPWSISEPDGY